MPLLHITIDTDELEKKNNSQEAAKIIGRVVELLEANVIFSDDSLIWYLLNNKQQRCGYVMFRHGNADRTKIQPVGDI
jgi:hypothetical protein